MNLPESAYLAIVVFSSDVQLIVPPGPIGNRKLEIANKILAVQPSGATAMCKTLKMGVSIFQQAPPEFFLRAYKITDGMSTDGNPLSWGEKLKNMGVILSLIGVGEGNQIDESLMRQMASFSEEKNAPRYFHFVDSVNMTGFFKRETTTVTK
jgi:Mg-chelatase subunit ChlD